MEREAFHRYIPLTKTVQITIGDEEMLAAEGVKSIYLQLNNPYNEQRIELRNTLYIPRLRHNLLSIYKVNKTKEIITFSDKECKISKDNTILKDLLKEGL